MNEEQQFNNMRQRMREFATPIEELEAQQRKINAAVIAARKAEVAQQAEVDAKRLRGRRDAARNSLPSVLTETLEYRASFLKAYETACVALGSFCRSWEQAEALTNELAVPLVGGSAEDRDNLRGCALASSGEVLNALRDSGYEGTLSYGWNFSYSVVPLTSKEIKQ